MAAAARVNFELVRDDATLRACCRQWWQAELLALDTEFVHTRSFFAHLGLIQLNDTRGCYLIDPLSISDFSPFTALMRSPKPIKIIHGCRQDMSVFYNHLRVLPEEIFDTQLAAAFLSHDKPAGYEKLTERLCGELLEKTPEITVSDWRRRPLSDAQMEYAARDVVWLPALFEELQAALVKKGRDRWFMEESRMRRERFFQETQAGGYARQQLSQLLSLPPAVHAVLEGLYEWRERQAWRKNLPRQWILGDKELLIIARNMPRDPQRLRELPLKNKMKKHMEEELLYLVNTILAREQTEESQWVRPTRRQSAEGIGKMHDWVRNQEKELQVTPGILMNKKDIFTLWGHIWSGGRIPLPSHFSGWREELAVKPMLQMLADLKPSARARGRSAKQALGASSK